jgi:hypothetical protein
MSNVRIAIKSDLVSDADKSKLLSVLAQQKNALERFRAENDITFESDPWSYDIVVTDKLLGFLDDSRWNPDQGTITIYGVDAVSSIIHEWIHAALPNHRCDRHAEGFAVYVQQACTTQAYCSPTDRGDIVHRENSRRHSRQRIGHWRGCSDTPRL